MKLLCLLALALLFATPCVFAQDIDPAIQQAITNALPPAYAGYGALALVVIAAVFRFLTARKNGLSVVEAILATLRGTNVPTKLPLLIGCLCMLTLSSCAGLTAFMASPAGQVTVALADLGLNVAAAKGKISPGDNVAIQRGLAIVTNPADPTSLKVFSLAELGLSTAVSKGVIKQGDALLIQEAGVIIKSAFLEPQIPSAKQPVSVTPKNNTASSVQGRELKRDLSSGFNSPRVDGPGCMQLAERIPLYGERVAFILSTVNVR